MKKLRNYLLLILVLVGIMFCTQDNIDRKYDAGDLSCWRDGYFIQQNVDVSRLDEGIIRAEVDNVWQEYKISNFPEKFIEWNIERRLETMERFRKHQPPGLSGPHSGIVATYGAKRKDSQFKINNAVKGMGFLPKKEKIKQIIQMLEATISNSFPAKLDTLTSLYNKADDIFDMDKQLSLELYTTPEFITQTFLNQILNPVSVIVFLDIPCYKLKTVVQLLHPDNPNLTDYEKDIVKYANLIHSYFHGEFSKNFISVVYHVVEVYDNSPGRKDAMGTRIVP